MVVWKTVGFTMVLLLVGMQAIPTELYEAAKIDGATWWPIQFFITVPLLRRTIALALIISVVGSFLAFDQFFIMTGGGPNNSTVTVVYWIYRASFTYFKLGYGSALSLLLMVILTAISVLQLIVLREPEKY
jgi:multiple sugar transport system permease protein